MDIATASAASSGSDQDASLGGGDADRASRPGRSVQGHLALFSVAIIVPMLVFAALLLGRIATAERARLEDEAFEIARSVAVSIDRELTGLFASLNVLSTSFYLQAGDMEGFHSQASELMRRQSLVAVVSDMEGQQLANLRLPYGAPLPKTNLPWDAAAIAAGRPYVTDLFTGQVSRQLQFAAVTSVLKSGTPTYVLNFSLGVDRLKRILDESEAPASYTVAIVDRAGTIMARSARHEEFAGKPATRDLQENTGGRQGSWAGTTLDGAPVFGAYARSRLSDFRVAVGIRYADLDAPLWRSLSLFVGLGIGITGFSFLLAWYLGQRISAPFQALAARAAALGRGELVEPLATNLAEANFVGAELAAAAANRHERETELREATEEIQRFAYIVSHDLRSPLVNIMGFTTELEALRQDVFARLDALRAAAGEAEAAKDTELASDVDEALGFIKAAIGKMDRLINAILGLSREGRRQFRPERIDMDALAATIKASVTHQAETAGAVVEVGKLPAVLSDRLAIEQVLSNLVDNALKYLRRGVPGRVEITGRATAAGMVYEVRDNGRGIEPRDRERVFDLFRRSGVQDRPGEGIGLAHVRALVRRLGGTIALTSELGQGSTFTVTLPRRWAGDRQGKAR